MSEFKGTPGPWFGMIDGHFNNEKNTWSLDDGDAYCSEHAPVTLSDGTVVAFAVASDDVVFWDDRVSANANLIAAAPELLDALQVLKRELVLSDVDLAYIESHFRPHIDRALAAISKALGQ